MNSLPLFAALWLPRFQLQAALRMLRVAPAATCAVLDVAPDGGTTDGKGRILHANAPAERAGVATGMTASQGLARCSSLQLLPRDAMEEIRAHGALLECALQWTPDYEATQPGLCVLDMSRSREARARPARCARQMREWLAARYWDARVGVAANPDLACLAARAADSDPVLALDTTEACESLRQLPVAVLQPSAPVADLLRLWGVKSLAQFAALARADIALRLGPEGARLWDIAAGGRERLLRLVRPMMAWRDELDLEHPVESLEPLLFILRRMLEDLCARLADVWLVAAAQRVELRFDDGTRHRRELRVAEPTRDAGLLLRVLHTHLDGLSARAPIVAVALELVPARPFGRQSNLFERALRDPNRFAETLAQLEALLGAGNVGWARLQPSRRPDAFVLINDPAAVALSASQAQAQAPAPGASGLGGITHTHTHTHGLPLRRFRPSKKVAVVLHEGRPAGLETAGRHLPITHASSPCLLSGDWWDCRAWQRETWEIATSDGALYQLAREHGNWVLDGVFG